LRDLADGIVHNGLQLLKKGMKNLAALVATYGNFCRLHHLLQQLWSHRAGNPNSHGLYHFSSQLSVLYVRLSARSTSVRARVDPTKGSHSLLTFLCWILSERQSLAMCNKLMQQIRYRSALMHFPVHLKISWKRKVVELATIECSPSEQQKPVQNSRFHMHGQQVCDSNCWMDGTVQWAQYLQQAIS
jgi:hypothetical protein